MKYLLIALLFTVLLSCNSQPEKVVELQKQIDKLETKLADCYKPGYGEMMNSIQSHHLKLWYAGEHKNWKLAKFEIKELKEVIEDIEKYQSKRKETKLIDMMIPEINSLQLAVSKQNFELFSESYSGLTNSCNNCHTLTNYDYISVIIPTGNYDFPNQNFNPKK